MRLGLEYQFMRLLAKKKLNINQITLKEDFTSNFRTFQ